MFNYNVRIVNAIMWKSLGHNIRIIIYAYRAFLV